MQTALVIGSGFGGLASALRLRALGLEVQLVERLDAVGGRARVFKRGGYRHDAGPTVITAPRFCLMNYLNCSTSGAGSISNSGR